MKVIINIDVPELPPAIAFYTAALALTHARTLDDDVAELTGASATIYLLQKDLGTRAVHAPPIDRDYGRHWTPVHFDLVVPDVDAAAARALAAGARQETGRVDWRGSRCRAARRAGGLSLDPRPVASLTRWLSSTHSESRKANT